MLKVDESLMRVLKKANKKNMFLSKKGNCGFIAAGHIYSCMILTTYFKMIYITNVCTDRNYKKIS